MNILNKIIDFFSKRKYPEIDVKAMQGIVPGGMYVGVGYIPGDSNKEWAKGEKEGICPACGKGNLVNYWQGDYYRLKCEECNYLDDTGMKIEPVKVELGKEL